jgi:hypothetical protein
MARHHKKAARVAAVLEALYEKRDNPDIGKKITKLPKKKMGGFAIR